MKPSLQRLWAAFPDHDQYPYLTDLYTWLGGTAAQNINAAGFGARGNTCASRLSVAFNKGGAPLSRANTAGLATIGAADGSRVIFRVSEFRTYLIRILGKPLVDDTTPFNDAFRGKRGIIAFAVNWTGASGHIALWNGITYREPVHDDYAAAIHIGQPGIRTSRGELWELT